MGKVIYKNKIITDQSLLKKLNPFIMEIKKHVKRGDVVFCKSNSHIGTYIQWLLKKEIEFTPVFISGEFSIRSINLLLKNIKPKIIIETKGEDCELHVINRIGSLTNKHLSDYKDSILFVTSATSGIPKIVRRTQEEINKEIRRYSEYLQVSQSDILLPIVPLYHSFGFISGMLLCLKMNMTLVIPDVILPRKIIDECNNHNVTIILGVPYFFECMIKLNSKYQFNDCVRYIISSGSKMPRLLQENFRERFGKLLFQQYGSTETGSLSIGYSSKSNRNVGKPFSGVEFKIVEDKNKNSCIRIVSETIGSYIINEEVVNLNKKGYKIGDIGVLTENGELEVIKRLDDILIVAGKKVDKNYVAKILSELPEIESVKIYLDESEKKPELVCEYSGNRRILKNEFFSHCESRLARYQIPNRYIKVNKVENWKKQVGN